MLDSLPREVRDAADGFRRHTERKPCQSYSPWRAKALVDMASTAKELNASANNCWVTRSDENGKTRSEPIGKSQ